MAVIINNTDITAVYGAIITQGGYDGIVEWPASKAIDSNDWHERNGLEADLSSLKLDSHSFTLKFGLKYSTPSQIEAFYDFLNSFPKITFSDSAIGVMKTLRVESMSSLRYAKSFSLLGVKVACDDNPLRDYSRVAPESGLCPADHSFKMDNIPFSDYGFRVLDGTYDSVLKLGNVKQSLLRSPSTIHGAEYDQNPLLWNGREWVRDTATDNVRLNSRQVTIKLGIIAPDLNTFWKNYKVLLYDLIHENLSETDPLLKCQRLLYIERSGQTLKCYYKNQSVKEFRILKGDRIWMKFDLTLEVIE